MSNITFTADTNRFPVTGTDDAKSSLDSSLSKTCQSEFRQRRISSPVSNLDENGRRRSIFKEMIDTECADEERHSAPSSSESRPRLRVRFRSKSEIHAVQNLDHEDEPVVIKSPSSRAQRSLVWLRTLFFAFLLAFMLPALRCLTLSKGTVVPLGASAGPIPTPLPRLAERDATLERRQSASTDVCKRWSQQSALVNGTLYLYGGRVMSDSSQTTDTWNNDLLTLDLTSDWQISSPALTGLPQPSGPPPVANGFLWNSYTQLFLYGGEYSDHPVTSPSPNALWIYDIPSSSWSSSPTPTTSAGDNSDGGGQPVQEAAEGAGVNIPSLGLGYYFGGHLDGYTTEGWSQSVARVYLRSMVEFTFPGFSNPHTNESPNAGSSGLWRNITTGGLQDSAGFTERADGILVYVPGYGKNGILLGLAGGTDATFTQMNVIDVYDIDTSTWYKQSTSGDTPRYRVNPCAVAVSAADGSSTNIYMYGGQNLLPYGQQTQYSDTWILTIPSFTWVEVDTSGQSVPPGRSGHTCNVWNSQMIVVGGYVGTDLSCDSPGIYVFDTVNLTWNNTYTSLETDSKDNPLNQQVSQQGDSSGLSGSYDYKVPPAVQSIIGGNAEGSATVTTPSAAATSGPFATGMPLTYTMTASGSASVATTTSKTTSTDSSGSVHTETAVSTIPTNGGGGSGGNGGSDNNGNGGPNIAAIVAGVIAGLLFLLAAYLGWCVWMYRRHLAVYKNHVSMAQRASLGIDAQTKTGLLFPAAALNGRSSDDSRIRPSDEGSSTGKSGRRNQGYQQVPSNAIVRKTEGGGFTTGDSSSGGRQADDSASISSVEDVLRRGEPSFMGVLLNPRRTLRVVNT